MTQQKRTDCNQLKPKPIPPAAVQLLDTLPARLQGETDIGYRERLDPNQRAMYDWFSKEVGEGANWQVYCEV